MYTIIFSFNGMLVTKFAICGSVKQKKIHLFPRKFVMK